VGGHFDTTAGLIFDVEVSTVSFESASKEKRQKEVIVSSCAGDREQ
jgi:hypothetical protein